MIVANGIRMHYQWMRASGADTEPPVVVFVHGLAIDSLASFYLTLAPPVAAAGIDAIAYDLRGHGHTEKPGDGYRVGDFVADLGGLLDALGVHQRVHLVGNSFGGTVAFAYAAAHPDRVASVVSIEAEPPTEPWAQRMRAMMAEAVEKLAEEGAFARIAEAFGTHHARLAAAGLKRLTSATMIEELPTGPLLDLAGLRAIRCPVLSIVGSEGFQQDDLGALERALPDCRTEVLAGQHHSVLVESHRTIRDLLLRWVGEHAGTPAGAR
ncbi:MAG TPA: alpha/beta hydrolase [Amycolatopsis sp.]|nr:alpha/beta hydrolase [Amycolatopsis sp.]